jgi:uncharacterized protein
LSEERVNLSIAGGGVIIPVKAVPRASRNEIGSVVGGEVQIRVTAAPVEGASNAAIIEVLSKILHIGKSQVEIISGQTARHKRIRVSGVTEDQVRAALGI